MPTSNSLAQYKDRKPKLSPAVNAIMSSPILFVFSIPRCAKSVSVTTCTARSSRKPRRKMPHSSRSRRAAESRSKSSAGNDPLLYENDIDTTDISTYVSCPICFNSLMVRPEILEKGPLQVNCNCCGKTTEARIEDLEDLDGTFDLAAWRIEYNAKQMTEEEIEELQKYAVDSFI